MPKIKKSNSNLFTFLIFFIVVGIISYFGVTKPPNSETYKIKPAGSQGGHRGSFINVTGKDADEKKIELSDDYWTDGKFKF